MGKKITESQLKVDKKYLYKNKRYYKTIDSINNDRVVWFTNYNTSGNCSTKHFLLVCPFEATEKEIYAIDNCA